MKKRRLVLASVLKPIDDTRMHEKIGRSLAEKTTLEIHIIGYPSHAPLADKNIHFHPLTRFTRISFDRVLAPLKVLLLIHKVKPEVLIITTHELLIVSLLNRIFFGVQIVYDIQENYYRNILFSKAFPPLIKQILAVWVRLKEVVLAPFVDHFFLAEKGYQNELNFSRRRFTILENKCGVVYPPTHRDPSKMKMIFSGTLSEVTGVFRAIALVKKLREINPKITLTIVGFTPVATTYERIQNEISGCPFITLIGGNCLVPHKQVLAEIASADFGLVSYYTPPSIENSIPTKLYEYLAHRLPMVLQNHSPWAELCAPYPAAIVVNFDQPLVDEILKAMTSKSFYVIPPQNVTWQSEEGRLLEAISSLT